MTHNMNNNVNRRVMTSAIDGMSVADVRKCLGEVRKQWTQQTVELPFFPTDKLSNGMMIQEFSLRFQKGHHQKRHRLGHGKGNKKSNNLEDGSSSSDEDDIYGFDSDHSPNSDTESKTSHIMTKSTTTTNTTQHKRSTFGAFSNTTHDKSTIHNTTFSSPFITESKTSNIIPEITLPPKIPTQTDMTFNNETNSLSSTLSSVTNKKRGRPKKKIAVVSPIQRGSHSRSLLEFVRKPEVKKIVSAKNKK